MCVCLYVCVYKAPKGFAHIWAALQSPYTEAASQSPWRFTKPLGVLHRNTYTYFSFFPTEMGYLYRGDFTKPLYIEGLPKPLGALPGLC